MMDCIKMEGMRFYGKHGVFPEENRLGQRFYVDLEMFLPLRAAGVEDRLEATVNYAEVYADVREVVEGRVFKLIESVAEQVAAVLLDKYPLVEEVTVRVLKPHPPVDMEFKGVTAQIHRGRAEA